MKRLLLILSLITGMLFSQQKKLEVTLQAYKEKTDWEFLPHAEAKIFINDTILYKTITPSNKEGALVFDLPFNDIYKINLISPGYLHRPFLISTENIPNSCPDPLKFLSFVSLIPSYKKLDTTINYELLKIPLVKYGYNRDEKLVTSDKDYSKAMTLAFNMLEKLELKTKLANEQRFLILKQENEKTRTEADLSRQKFIRNISLLSVGFLIVFLIFIFSSLQKNIRQKKIISEKHIEIEKQKEIILEKQKDIIDSITYARRIQRSLLPTEKYLDKTLGRMADKKPIS